MLFLAVAASVSYAAAQHKTVRVGWYETPFNITEKNGGRSGYAYEYQQRIAAYTGWKYEYVKGTWAELMQMLENGEIDLMTDVAYTEERARKMLFSEKPMGVEHYSLFIRRGDAAFSRDDTSCLKGKKAGVLKNTHEAQILKDRNEQKNLGLDIIEFNAQDSEIWQQVLAGELDCFFSLDIFDYENSDVVAELGASDFYFAVCKDRPDLIKELDAALQRLSHDDADFDRRIAGKYFGSYSISRLLTEAEKDRLTAHGPIRVGYRDDYLPFCGTDGETGKATGMLKTYLDTASGLFYDAKLSFELKAYPNTAAAKEALKKGEIDCVFPLDMSLSEAEADDVLVSNAVVETQMDLLVPQKRFSDISPKGRIRIAVNYGNLTYLRLLDTYFPDCERVFFEDTPHGFEGIGEGKADGIVMSSHRLSSVKQYIDRYDLAAKKTNALIRCCFLVARGDRELYSVLNRIIGLIDGSSVQNMIIENTPTVSQVSFLDFIRAHAALTLALCILILFLMTVLLLRSLRAEKCVRKAYGELSAVNGQLLEKQSELEEAAVLQESHLREITALNERLSANNERIEQLNRSIKENLEIMANTGYGIWRITMKPNGRHTMVADETLKKILGISDRQMSGEELYVYYHSRLRENVAEIEAEDYAKMSKGKLQGRILKYDNPARGIILLNAGGTIYESRGEEVTISGYSGDVTQQENKLSKLNEELEKARLQAEAANKAKSVFLFNMSHDIRTPMNAILGFTRLIGKAGELSEEQRDYIRKIEYSGEYLLSVINDVLDMARIESGKVELEELPVDLLDEDNKSSAMLSSEFEKKGLVFTSDIDVSHRYVYADSAKMQQIIMNLLSNAIKYTPAGGEVHCDFREVPSDREGYARFVTSVSDTGIGMSPDFVKQIFDSFTREKTSTENRVTGTGLGMAIVKRMVDMMGGTIDVRSEQGKGSTFTITVDFRIAEASDLPQKKSAAGAVPDLTGKRILLAEDNELNAEIAAAILEETGAVIEYAANGAICLDMLKKADAGRYDLILMDIQMPNMNGYEAAKAIRALADKEKASVPIIAMTANAFEEDKREALSAGMNGHVAKPVSVGELMKVLTRVLG